MHRIEIEQVADHDLSANVTQRLRAFVFISRHRAHRFALLQQQFGDRAPYPADAARRAGDQNGIHVLSSYHSFLPWLSVTRRIMGEDQALT
jgi:hypothetical protein